MTTLLQRIRPRTAELRAWGRRVFEGGDAQAFSPALLQVHAAPPAPLARAIAGAIALSLVVVLGWSVWADFDIVVSAPGLAVASSKTKVIQPLEAGRVMAIHVQDGDEVAQGDPVLVLDATVAVAERERIEHELQEAALDVLRASAQLQGRHTLGRPEVRVSDEQWAWHAQLLQHRTAEQAQKLGGLAQEVARKRAELAAVLASIQKIEGTLPLLQQRLAMREQLLGERFMAELTVIDSRLEVAAQQSEWAVQQARRQEAESALASAQHALAQAQAEHTARLAAERTDAQRRLQAARQELVKASHRETHQVLTAPIAGTVQQRAVHTVGGVVNPGQGLMVVVPKEGGIEVEAQVPNKDVGFLRVGMPATIKLDAFEFTKYGTLDAVVQWIGADAIRDERLGAYFPVRLLLHGKRLPVSVNGQHPEIRIGMAVTADMAIGQRKAYEYFLGPLLKYQQESLRER